LHQFTFKNIFWVVITLLVVSQVRAQESESLAIFYGQVVTDDNKPIALAHIININTKRGIVSDTLGFFKMNINPNDILNISAIGFEYFEYQIPEIISNEYYRIHLKRKYYQIPEVTVKYFGTYKDFEYKVVHLKLEDKNAINESIRKTLPHIENPVPYEPTLGSPVSLLYDIFSKEGKSRRKYQEIMKNEPIKKQIELKYNTDIVKNITGLEGDELKEFMDTCNFTDEYILNTSDYIIYSTIFRNYENFKKSRIKQNDSIN